MTESTRKRSLFKAAFIAAALLLSCWFLIALLLGSSGFRDYLETALGRVWRGNVKIADSSLRFPASLELKELRLLGANSEKEWLSVERVCLEPSLQATFSRLSRMRVEGLELNLELGERALLPGPLFSASSAESAAYRDAPMEQSSPEGMSMLPFEEISLQGARINLVLQRKPFWGEISFDGLRGAAVLDHQKADMDYSLRGKSALFSRFALQGGASFAGGLEKPSTEAVLEIEGISMAGIPGLLNQEMADFIGKIRGTVSTKLELGYRDSSLKEGSLNLQGREIDIPLPLGRFKALALKIQSKFSEGSSHFEAQGELKGMHLTGMASSERAQPSLGASLDFDLLRDGVILRLQEARLEDSSTSIGARGFFSVGEGDLLSSLADRLPAYEIECRCSNLLLETAILHRDDGDDGDGEEREITLKDGLFRLVPGALKVDSILLQWPGGEGTFRGSLNLSAGGFVNGRLSSEDGDFEQAQVQGLLFSPQVELWK